MSQWLGEAPRLGALLAVFYIPGLILAHSFHYRQSLFLRLAVAPAWTAGLVGVLALGYGKAGLAWTVWSALPGFIVAFALAFGIYSLLRRRSEAVPAAIAAPPMWQPALASLAFGLVAALPILTTIPPDGIIQGGDSQFHIGLLWQIEQDGIASPLTASAGMMGLDRSSSFYPTAWHAILALVTSGTSQVLATTNVMLVVAPIMWIFSTMALTWAVTKNRTAMWWSLAASAMVPMALVRLELITTLWPFVVGMSIMPGALAMFIAQAREVPTLWRNSPGLVVVTAMYWMFPALGLAIFHPSTFLPAVAGGWFVGLVYASWKLWCGLRARTDIRHATPWAGLIVFLIAAPQLIYRSPYASLFQLHRAPNVSFKAVPAKLTAALNMYSLDGAPATAVFHFTVIVLSVLTAVTVWLWCRNRLLVLAWVAQVLLILACFFPVPIFNRLTSLYYNVAVRALVGEAVFLVPMMGLALAVWAGWLAQRLGRVSVMSAGAAMLAFAAITGLSFPENARASHEMVYPEVGDVRYLASGAELDMLRRASSLPADSYILGDPAAGASLVQVAAGRRAVFPYPGMDFGEKNTLLVEHFRDIHFNPRICSVVREFGITHFYADRPGWYNSSYTSQRRPGLYHVDTTRGFTLVDRGGSAALYRIDMCSDPTWVFDKPPAPPRPGDLDTRPGRPSVL